MEVKYHQHIGIYKNAISNEWCDKVINYFEDNIEHAVPRNIEGGSSGGIRDNSNLLLDKILANEFTETFFKLFDLYTYKYPYFPSPITLTGYKLQKTLPTEGYHTWHVEHNEGYNNEPRAFVFSIYLNDVEEGGETEFLHFSKRVQPKTGRIVIWPAGFPYVHRGNPPL